MAAIQNLAKRLHTKEGKPVPPGNLWQNLDRLTKRWRIAFGADLLDGLDAATIQTLRLALARRHLLDHNGGVVDPAYVEQTGEGTLGRKVRITPAFVASAFTAFTALADRLEATAVSGQ